MKKILIFTAGFGEGHNSAARGLRDAIERLEPDEAKVEILDLFDTCYGKVNDLMRRTYISAINKTPKLWSGFYKVLDKTSLIEFNLPALGKMQAVLEDLLKDVQPDVVVSVYPVYNYLINEIYADSREKPFPLVTVITDSITINSFWYRTESDYFVVANDLSARVLLEAGITGAKIKTIGFPVTPVFTDLENFVRPEPPTTAKSRKKIFYMLNSGRKKADKIIRKLLKHEDYDLTISVGKDPKIKAEIEELVEEDRNRVTILGWTNEVPKYMVSHHILISKAGGATTQEAIAGKIPMIVTQVVPGQEEGNAQLIEKLNVGAIAEEPDDIIDWIERAFDNHASLWCKWRENLEKAANPAAAMDIGEFILSLGGANNTTPRKITTFTPSRDQSGMSRSTPEGKSLLLCDFHMHSRYSDGKLNLTDLVDFYGSRGFDCICVTDHIADYTRVLGKLTNLSGLVLPRDQVNEYFDVLEKERQRAMRKYGMILMSGLEFNKDGLTKNSSAHLLGIDLKGPIDPGLSIEDTIFKIHEQGALAVAAHPHKFKSAWGKNTLYFWEKQEEYAHLLDAWEIANRDDIFNPIGLKKLPIIANSDFHKPKHIYSWKTMLFCEKSPEAIKECIRQNQDIAITLYRDHRFGYGNKAGESETALPASPSGLKSITAA